MTNAQKKYIVNLYCYPNLLPAWPVSLESVKIVRSSSAGAGIAEKCGQ